MNSISSATPISLPLPTTELANLQNVADNAAKATEAEIKKVGEDFEAIFMSMLLKEMRNTISSEEDGGLFAGEGSDTYGSLFDTFVGQHLASANQLGISQAIQSYLGNKVS